MQSKIQIQRSGRLVAVITMILAAVLAACSDVSGPTDGRGAVASVQVAAASGLYTGVLVQGDTLRLTAIARSAGGDVVSDRPVSWVSTDTSVALVSSTGVVRAVRQGQVRIRATIDGAFGETIIQVVTQGDIVHSVTIQAASAALRDTLFVGDTVRLVAVARTAAGDIIEGRPVSWASGGDAIATVDAAGLLTARGTGTVGIGATIDGISGNRAFIVIAAPAPVVAQVVVSPTAFVLQPGATRNMTARAYDAEGIEIHGRAVQWTSSAPTVATVTAGGIVTAVGPGYGGIQATIDGVTGGAALTVEAPEPVAWVIVTPMRTSTWVGGTQQLQALTLGQNGGDLTGRTVAWYSENPAIATVDANGVVKGMAPGTTRIFASSEGRTGSATVAVYAPPLGTVHAYRINGRTDMPGSPVYIGTTDWTDGSGVTHRVARFVERGSFTMDFVTSRYRQTMEIDLYTEVGFTRIATITVVDEGTWSYSFDPSGYYLRSDDATLPEAFAGRLRAGELVISRSVAGSPAISWEWVLDQ